MAESFFEKRRQELGLTNQATVKTGGSPSGDSSFFEKRKMDLGIIPLDNSKNANQINIDRTAQGKALITKKANEESAKKKLKDAGLDLSGQVKTFEKYNSGVEARAVARKAEEDAKPSYSERVNKRVEDEGWPELLKPVGELTAAIAEIPFSRAVKQRATMYPELEDPKDRVGGVAGLAADIAIPLTIPNAGLGGVGLYNQAGNSLQRFAPKLSNSIGGRITGEVIKGGATGVPVSVGTTLATNPDASKEELLMSAVYGAGGGALLGGAGRLVGEAAPLVKNGLDAGLKPLVGTTLRQADALDSVALEALPLNVRRTVSANAVPEIFPNRYRRSFNNRSPVLGTANQERAVNPNQASEIPSETPKIVGSRVNSSPQIKNENISGEVKTGNLSSDPSEIVRRERGLVGNIEASGKMNEDAMSAIRQKDNTYEPINNAETVKSANARLENDGLGNSKEYLMSKDTNKHYFSPEDIALGFRLIDEYSALKDYNSVAELVSQLSKAGTKSGQAVQINAIFNRLTPEGVLKVATRVLNEGVKDVGAQKVLSPELTERLTTAATAMREASGNQSIAKDAISIIEKARLGETLTDAEVATLRKMSSDIKKVLPNKELPEVSPKDRKIDRITRASNRAADEARKRLKASRNQLNATPLGYYKDLAIIGFDYMMKGAVKFTDFAGKMTSEFGSHANEVIDKAYLHAYKRYRRVNNIPQSEFEKMTNRAIAGEGFREADADALRKMAIELSQLEGAVKNEAMAELQLAFNTLREGTWGKKAASVLRSFQLGNARTILRNEVSNNAFYALEQVKRKFIDTPIDVVASKITGKDREIFFKDGFQSWRQYFSDWKTGYSQGRKGLNPGGLQSQYDLGNLAFNPSSTKLTDKLGSFLERNVGAFLKAGDYAASNRAISTELSQLSRAKAYAEGFRGKDLTRKSEEYFHTADDVMSEQAEQYGKYMTFQDKNFLSDAAVNLRDKVLNAGKDFGLGNIVINYPKTPANIFMRAIDYSPLGFVKFMGQMGKGIIGKEVTKKQLINTFTRALSGTGIAGMGMYLSHLGILNVLPSKNVGMSELERKSGKIPNSLNLDALKRYVTSFGDPESAKPKKGDTFASIDWFQPIAIPMSVGAAYGQADQPGRLKTSINAADVATQSIDASLESFGNMSAYKNIKDLVGSTYNTPSEKLGKLSANAASAFVPSLVGQLRNVADPYQRDPKEPGFFGQAKGQLMNRIPGLSNQLPVKIDTFGDEKKNDFSVGKRILNAFVNPSIVDSYEPSPEAKAVLELIERTGETRLAPDRPQKSFTYKKQTYGFEPDDYREYQKETGQLITQGIQKNLEYLNNPNVSDEKKIKRMDMIIADAGEKAKKSYRKLKGIK